MSSKQFESFLADQLLSWAINEVKPGFRYQFKSPDSNNSQKLFGALTERSVSSIDVAKGISLPYIDIKGCKLLPVLHTENPAEMASFTENYISHLRDEIAGQNGALQGCALVIIHNSLLDTLINSADDLAQRGNAWYPGEIHQALVKLIHQQDSSQKVVSSCLLDYQFDVIDEDGATMFGFKDIYDALKDGDLCFSKLDMFDDPIVLEMRDNSSQIKKRLDENRELFAKVQFTVDHFSDQLDDQLNMFGSKFIKDNFNETDAWKDLRFDQYRNEMKKNSVQHLLLESESLAKGNLISRNKSESKAGQRDRQLIIELDEGQTEFTLKLNFSGASLDKKDFKIQHNKSLMLTKNLAISGRTFPVATFSGEYKDEPLFFTLAMVRENSAEKYKFRVLVLRKGEFWIEPFRNVFIVDSSKKHLTLQMDENNLQIRENGEGKTFILQKEEKIDTTNFAKVDFDDFANQTDEIIFHVASGENTLTFNVEGAVPTDSFSLPLMLNRGRFTKLFRDDYNGVFYRKKGKVAIDGSEFLISKVREELLHWEAKFVDEKWVTVSDDETRSLPLSALRDIDSELFDAYSALMEYFEHTNTLPSLASWGDEFQACVQSVVTAYLNYVEAIALGNILSPAQKKVVGLGMLYWEGDEYMSPFHPLNLAYFLYLCEQIQADEKGSFKYLPDVTISRLSPKGLLPYVYHKEQGFAYTQQVKENAFWLRQVPNEESSYAYVRKLVKEKINEFRNAYSTLFESRNDNRVIINAVNQGKAKELFMGLVDIIKEAPHAPLSLHVNLYDNNMMFSAFDEFSESASYDDIKAKLELDKGKYREQADSIIDALRSHLTYSKFTHEQAKDGQSYSHLTFFRSNERVECSDVSIADAASGVACDGLLSGEASESKSGSYFTGFGLRNIDTDDLPHLRVANALGGLLKPAIKLNTQYHGSNALALAVNENFKELLERSYDNSIWTTIIDPKVTLDFFHSNQDVVLIHYSDQYTSSSSYDAITVTRNASLFEKLLEQGRGSLVNEFNAFNGDWLLGMLRASPKDRKEKKGIIGAYKFIASVLKNTDITWVPLSVAEMVRVSGNIGLKMSDSDFSRNVHGYKKGAISDDILFVGLCDNQIHLLPVEVKTGSRPDFPKAVKQAKELRRYLEQDVLGPQTLAGHLYRGLFMQQVFMQVDKFKLYNVFEQGYFDSLKPQRERWLSGHFSMATLAQYPKGFVVCHDESDTCFEPNYTLRDGILIAHLPHSLLQIMVENPLQVVMNELDVASMLHVPEQYLLAVQAPEVLEVSLEAIEADPTSLALTYIDIIDETVTSSIAVEPAVLNISKPEINSLAEQVTESAEFSNVFGKNNLKVLFGHNELTQAPLRWEPTNTARFMNTNTGIIGTMGTGKTQFTKSVITQLHRNKADNVDGKAIGILIFDYKSDYVDEKFQDATAGKKFDLHRLPYNPLSLFGDTPMLPVHTARGFAETMGKAFGLGQKQQLRLRKLVGEAYDLAGIKKADKSTWSRPAPTIDDVWALFIDNDPTEDSLYAALESLYDLEIFENDVNKCTSLYELVDGISVIMLAGYSSEIQNLVVALTLDLFYSQMQKKGKPEVQGDFRQITKMILVDEADNFMSQNFPSLRRILKEGREYGVGMILSTQDITHFQTGENDYSSYVLTWVIHRVSKIKAQDIKAIFSVNEKAEQERLMQTINKLEKHCSLYIDGDKKIVKMRDKAFWELF